jgi:hypothetical protein
MIVVGMVIRLDPNDGNHLAPVVVGVWSDTRAARAGLRTLVDSRKILPSERVWLQTAATTATTGV